MLPINVGRQKKSKPIKLFSRTWPVLSPPCTGLCREERLRLPLVEEAGGMMANRVSPCSCSYAPASLAPGAYASFSGRRLPAHIPQACRRARTLAAAALHAPEHLQDLLPPLVDHLTMAYERVTLPCHSMGCGDYVHRRRAPCMPHCCAARARPAPRRRRARGRGPWLRRVTLSRGVRARAARWTLCCGWSTRA